MKAEDYFSGDQLTLARAIDQSDATAVQRLVLQGMPLNAIGKGGLTPLVYAIGTIRKPPFRALLELRADVSIPAPDGETAVTLAARLAKTDLQWLQMAIEIGHADPNTRMPGGKPLLVHFIATRNAQAIAMLASHGADLNIQDESGRPAAIATALAGDYEILELLLRLGADPTTRSLGGRTLLEMVSDDPIAKIAPGSPKDEIRARVLALIKAAMR